MDVLQIEIAGLVSAKANGTFAILVLAGIVALICISRLLVPLLQVRKPKRKAPRRVPWSPMLGRLELDDGGQDANAGRQHDTQPNAQAER